MISDLERPELGREPDDGVWSEQGQGDAFSAALARQNMRGSMSSDAADVKG